MTSVGCDSLVGAIGLGILGFCTSSVVVEEGGGGWAGSGAGGTGLEGLGSVVGMVVGVGLAAPGGGGCEGGPGVVPADAGGFFWPGIIVLNRL